MTQKTCTSTLCSPTVVSMHPTHSIMTGSFTSCQAFTTNSPISTALFGEYIFQWQCAWRMKISSPMSTSPYYYSFTTCLSPYNRLLHHCVAVQILYRLKPGILSVAFTRARVHTHSPTPTHTRTHAHAHTHKYEYIKIKLYTNNFVYCYQDFMECNF